MLEYYPKRPDIAAVMRQFPGYGLKNRVEEMRLQDIADKKARGKGTPKKAKTKGACRFVSIKIRKWLNCGVSSSFFFCGL